MDYISEPVVSVEIRGVRSSYWSDLWRHRELLYSITWHSLVVRYKQTVLGSAWTIVRPLITMLVFTLVMRVARFPTPGAPVPIFVWAGLLPWLFFASGLNDAAMSVVSSSNVFTKIFFPRLVLPISALLGCMVDLAISFVLLIVLALFLRFLPSPHIWALPFFIVELFALTLGLGAYCAAKSVRYRDLRQIIPVIIQLGLYATPVFYPVQVIGRLLPQKWLFLYSLNPLVGIIEGFRWSIIGRQIQLDSFTVIVGVVESFAILIFGITVFRKTEMTFADYI